MDGWLEVRGLDRGLGWEVLGWKVVSGLGWEVVDGSGGRCWGGRWWMARVGGGGEW